MCRSMMAKNAEDDPLGLGKQIISVQYIETKDDFIYFQRLDGFLRALPEIEKVSVYKYEISDIEIKIGR